jgi:hypothetical protein
MVEKPDKKKDNRDMKAFDDRSTIPAHEDCVILERYDQRIPDIDSDADGNEQVQSAKVWPHGRLKKIREVQLGDPTQPIETAGNGYLGN